VKVRAATSAAAPACEAASGSGNLREGDLAASAGPDADPESKGGGRLEPDREMGTVPVRASPSPSDGRRNPRDGAVDNPDTSPMSAFQVHLRGASRDCET